jgi:hypothetical protein
MAFFDKTKPIGLPDGSVRAILTLAIVGSSIVMAFMDKVPVEVLALLGVVVNDYFGQRKAANDRDAQNAK